MIQFICRSQSCLQSAPFLLQTDNHTSTHLIHYKVYISILSRNLDVEIYKFILPVQIYIFYQV